MKKLLALFAAVLFMGCNWGSSVCSCGVDCCESGNCSTVDCNCACK